MASAASVRGAPETKGAWLGAEGPPAVGVPARVAQTSEPTRPGEVTPVRVVSAALGSLVAAAPKDASEAIGGAW